jgi:hypothetical protein
MAPVVADWSFSTGRRLGPGCPGRPGRRQPAPGRSAALVLGTRLRDKERLEHVVIGLGDRPTLVALIAVDASAPGAWRVTMPSPYSSEGTRGGAHVGRRPGVELLELPIGEGDDGLRGSAGRRLRAAHPTSPRGNLQARFAAAC